MTLGSPSERYHYGSTTSRMNGGGEGIPNVVVPAPQPTQTPDGMAHIFAHHQKHGSDVKLWAIGTLTLLPSTANASKRLMPPLSRWTITSEDQTVSQLICDQDARYAFPLSVGGCIDMAARVVSTREAAQLHLFKFPGGTACSGGCGRPGSKRKREREESVTPVHRLRAI